ncbi:MAG: hypothetical protein QMC80_04150 [Thermoplasmatales archaeon]|nr:hypothetical protein [Thermoplasmatales archaeon]
MMIDLLKCRKLCLFLFVLLISTLIIPQFALAKEYDNNVLAILDAGDYKAYPVGSYYYSSYLKKGDKIEAEINVKSGGNIDVYLLYEEQYDDYLEDANNTNTSKIFTFIENGSKQNTKQFSYTHNVEYDGKYYIIIDNRDNSQADDAVPTGNVEVEMGYSRVWTGYNGLYYPEIPVEAILICAATFIILIVIIIAVVIVITKKEKKNIPPPPMPPNFPQTPQPR